MRSKFFVNVSLAGVACVAPKVSAELAIDSAAQQRVRRFCQMGNAKESQRTAELKHFDCQLRKTLARANTFHGKGSQYVRLSIMTQLQDLAPRKKKIKTSAEPYHPGFALGLNSLMQPSRWRSHTGK
jgi:hypothetical protein